MHPLFFLFFILEGGEKEYKEKVSDVLKIKKLPQIWGVF
jgi:hypothetical protein